MSHPDLLEILGWKDNVLHGSESFAAGGLALPLKQLEATKDLFTFMSRDIWPVITDWKEDEK